MNRSERNQTDPSSRLLGDTSSCSRSLPPCTAEDTARGERANGTSPLGELLQNRLAVLALLFLVTGCLGIPLLWVNKRFTTGQRVLWSIVVTLYTAALVAIVAAVWVWSYRRLFA